MFRILEKAWVLPKKLSYFIKPLWKLSKLELALKLLETTIFPFFRIISLKLTFINCRLVLLERNLSWPNDLKCLFIARCLCLLAMAIGSGICQRTERHFSENRKIFLSGLSDTKYGLSISQINRMLIDGFPFNGLLSHEMIKMLSVGIGKTETLPQSDGSMSMECHYIENFTTVCILS